MPSGGARGEIRPIGASARQVPEPHRPPTVVAAGLLAIIAVAATILSHTASDGIDASIITDPALTADTRTSTTSGPETGPPLPVTVPEPLNLYVPGFTGTLIMTTGFSWGMEVWTWSSGPEGTLTRVSVPGDLVDARPDAGGEKVAALREYADHPPWLVVANGTEVIPVFFGAQSFAWHATEPGDIAWLSQTSTEEPPTLYIGSQDDGGLYFKPVADLDGYSSMTIDRPADRIVGYDAAGFIVEHWDFSNGLVVPSVARLDAGGHLVMSLDGYFVGASPNGGMAVHDLGVTRIAGPESSAALRMPSASTSAVWSPAGDRLAVASDGSTIATIEQTDSDVETSFDLRLDHLTVKAWSRDGRFVIVSGYVGDQAYLVFIDTLEDAVWPVPVEGNPIGVVVP